MTMDFTQIIDPMTSFNVIGTTASSGDFQHRGPALDFGMKRVTPPNSSRSMGSSSNNSFQKPSSLKSLDSRSANKPNLTIKQSKSVGGEVRFSPTNTNTTKNNLYSENMIMDDEENRDGSSTSIFRLEEPKKKLKAMNSRDAMIMKVSSSMAQDAIADSGSFTSSTKSSDSATTSSSTRNSRRQQQNHPHETAAGGAETSIKNTRSTTTSRADMFAESFPAVEDKAEFLDDVSLILLDYVHSDFSEIVVKALGVLADLCTESRDLHHQACYMGAPAIVVATMNKWSTDKLIQFKCIQVMIALTVMGWKNSNTSDDKIQKIFWMMGGMETILSAMRTHQDSRSVQFYGCNAILSLLPSVGMEEETPDKFTMHIGRRFVGDLKGVKIIIGAMIRFEDDRKVQEAGCSVLLKLATFMHHGKDRKMLFESGAMSAFSVALESHPNDENMHNYASMFMNLLSGNM